MIRKTFVINGVQRTMMVNENEKDFCTVFSEREIDQTFLERFTKFNVSFSRSY